MMFLREFLSVSLLLSLVAASAPVKETHSALEGDVGELREAQQMIKEARHPHPVAKTAEERRKDAMMHMAELARAGKGKDLRDEESEEEEAKPAGAPKGLPGFGALHTLIADSSLKSVKVTHVRNLVPAKLKGLKNAVEKMHATVGASHDSAGHALDSKPEIPMAPSEDGAEEPELVAPKVVKAKPQQTSAVDARARRARDAAMASAAAVPASSTASAVAGSREAIHLKFKETMMNHSAAMNKALEETIREKQAATRDNDRLQQRAEEVAAKMKEAEEAASQPESVHTMVARTEHLSDEHQQASLKVSREDARRKVWEYREAQRERREKLGTEIAAREEAEKKMEAEAAERAETEAAQHPHATHSGVSAMTQSLGALAFVITIAALVV